MQAIRLSHLSGTLEDRLVPLLDQLDVLDTLFLLLLKPLPVPRRSTSRVMTVTGIETAWVIHSPLQY